MNPIILNVICDNSDNVIFKFPQNTLLDKISDVWPLIMSYYTNYYPFTIGIDDENYRELTYDEAKTDQFIKLFAIAYRKNNIRFANPSANGCLICVEKHPLRVGGNNVFMTSNVSNGMYQLLVRNSKTIPYGWNANFVENIWVADSLINEGNKIYVLLDLVF